MRHVRGLEVLVAIISSPVQVFFHLTVRREDERVLETTRLSEDGVEGSGVPKAFMLGKGQRMPRGWELALYGGPLLPQCLCNCTAMNIVPHVVTYLSLHAHQLPSAPLFGAHQPDAEMQTHSSSCNRDHGTSEVLS